MKDTQVSSNNPFLKTALQVIGAVGTGYIIYKLISAVCPKQDLIMSTKSKSSLDSIELKTVVETRELMEECLLRFLESQIEKSENDPGYVPGLRESVEQEGGLKALWEGVVLVGEYSNPHI